MRTLAIDKDTGGFVIVAGRPTYIDEAEAKAQQVRIRLQTIQGEYFLNLTLGIPYFQNILIKNPNLQFIEFLYSEALRDLGLINIEIHGSYEKDTRRFILAWRAVDPETSNSIGGVV